MEFVEPVLTTIPDVFQAVTAVLTTISHVFPTIADILEPVTKSALVAGIPAVLEPVQPIFTPVEHILPSIAPILAPIADIFDAVPHDRTSAGRSLGEQRCRAHEGEYCRSGNGAVEQYWRTHNDQPPIFRLPGW